MASDVYFRSSCSLRGQPCCAVGRFISRRVRITAEAGPRHRVRVAGSHGRAGEAGFLPISAGEASIHIVAPNSAFYFNQSKVQIGSWFS